MKRTILLIFLISITAISTYFYKIYIIDYDYSKSKEMNKIEKEKEKIEKLSVELYIPYEYSYLKKEEYFIEKKKTQEENIIEIFNLLNEKVEEINDKTKLLELFLNDDILYLNLTSDISEKIDTSEKELLMIYSIVNTFTGVYGIEKIKFLIDNRDIKSICGYIDASNPFKKDNLLIKGD